MKGTFYVVGVGPGDPELLTLKAVGILTESPVWLVPAAQKNGDSTALAIACGAVSQQGKKIITHHFPMKKIYAGQEPNKAALQAWQQAAELISDYLRSGQDVVLPTLGDPAIYSTGFYVCETLLKHDPACAVQIIPGVSAVGASAAAAGTPLCLGNERLLVVPAVFADDDLRLVLQNSATIAFMKVHNDLERLVPLLKEFDLIDKAVLIERAGMADQRIYRDLRNAMPENLHYFSTLIVRKS